MAVELLDFSIKVTEAMEDALIAGLYEAAGEIEAGTKRNSRQGHTYGDIQATALWDNQVDEAKMEASIGSPYEAGFWEEFGTGEHALNGDGRKGWWIYVEGQDSGSGGKTYSSQEEAEAMAASMRSRGIPAHATNGIDPNRPLHRAFSSGKSVVKAIFAEKLKGLG